MAEIKWSEFPLDAAAQPEDSEVMLLRGGSNVRAPGVNWKGDQGDKGDTGDTGPQGPQGIQGVPGNDGADGVDGKTVLSGNGAPSAGLGVDGDFYINTATWDIYGPKTGGSWGAPTSLIGPEGPAGAAGEDGKTVLNGSGAPSGATGVDGDFYIDTDTWDIYGPKTAGVWGGGTSLIGPQGPQGDAGTGYILQGDATVAELNALTAASITTGFAWQMLDAGTVQPIGALQGTAVVAGDLVVWAEADYFVNYGQAGGASQLDDLTDVIITTPVNDDVLAYDGAGNFTNQTAAQAGLATASQGALADTATQPGDNVSNLTNDAGYLSDAASTDAGNLINNGTDSKALVVQGDIYEYGTALPAPGGYPEGFLFLVYTP